MKVITEGHRYELSNFEKPEEPGQEIQFIHKKKADGGAFETESDGTTNEEVLEMLIDRTKTLNAMFPCRENSVAITKMEEALMWFDKRTADREKRGVEGKPQA